MTLGIYTNLNRDKNAEYALILARILVEKGIDFFVCDNAKQYFALEKCKTLKELTSISDFLFVFGGDGTMLDIVDYSSEFSTPLVGVNLGHIGFLTEVDRHKLENAVDNLISNHFSIENRAMLCAEFLDKNNKKCTQYSLNEVILSSNTNCHISNIQVYIDGNLADKVRGDGVIVSTPTGSTAYSLSCNGSILDPKIKGIIVNTICPHSLHSCPMVVSDERTINLKSSSQNMSIIFDGRKVFEYTQESEIVIKKASKHACFVRFDGQNFYQKLLQKLSYWGE